MTFSLLIMITPIVIAAIIGYLAQWVGLCMVRGVNELLAGKPNFIAAILCSGLWVWVALISSTYIGHSVPLHSFSTNLWFAFGGLIFGLGTALNQGCGISTLSLLSRGELKMMSTIAGWVLGWILLAKWPIQLDALVTIKVPDFVLPSLIISSVLVTLWVLAGNHQRRKIWLGIMTIGLLAGLLFTFEPNWPPSALLRDVSAAAVEKSSWPTPARFGLFGALAIGMMLAALQHQKFKLSVPNLTTIGVHLLAGTLMGVGGAMAMGGNDAQLILALPTLSLSSIITILSMIIGIIIGLKLPELTKTLSYKLRRRQK